MQTQENLTFEEKLEKTRLMIEETSLQMKETDRKMQETDRKMQETDRKIGKLGNRLGEMIEYMVMPNLLEKFPELGFVFTKAYPHAVLRDEKNNFLTEIDVTLENGEKVMIVEVKTKPSTEDISDHVERMEKIRHYADQRNDKRKYLGAVAGMIINENEKLFAFKNGFYVVEPSGETFNIIVPEGSYAPREW